MKAAFGFLLAFLAVVFLGFAAIFFLDAVFFLAIFSSI
jgi:hypothetical protein